MKSKKIGSIGVTRPSDPPMHFAINYQKQLSPDN